MASRLLPRLLTVSSRQHRVLSASHLLRSVRNSPRSANCVFGSEFLQWQAVRAFTTSKSYTKQWKDNIVTCDVPDVTIPDVTITELIEESSKKWPKREALIDGTTGKSLTYEALMESVHVLVNRLLQKGLKKGNVVCVIAPNSIEHYQLMLAVPAAGGIYTSISPSFTTEETGHRLDDCKASFVFCSPTFVDKMNEIRHDHQHVKEFFVLGEAHGYTPFSALFSKGKESSPPALPAIKPYKDIAMLPFSCGTTGVPKGVMLTHQNVVSETVIFGSDSGIDRLFRDGVESSVVVFPQFHVAGSIGCTYNMLYQGFSLIIYPFFHFEDWLSAVQKYKPTVAVLPPSVLLALAKSPVVTHYDISSLETVVSVAGPVSKDLQKEVAERLTNIRIAQMYGMVELSLLSHVDYSTKYGSAGKILPNLQFKVVDTTTGEALGQDQTGEICIKGPVVMKGYWQNPEATLR